jgi:hypothetical protein
MRVRIEGEYERKTSVRILGIKIRGGHDQGTFDREFDIVDPRRHVIFKEGEYALIADVDFREDGVIAVTLSLERS